MEENKPVSILKSYAALMLGYAGHLRVMCTNNAVGSNRTAARNPAELDILAESSAVAFCRSPMRNQMPGLRDLWPQQFAWLRAEVWPVMQVHPDGAESLAMHTTAEGAARALKEVRAQFQCKVGDETRIVPVFQTTDEDIDIDIMLEKHANVVCREAQTSTGVVR